MLLHEAPALCVLQKMARVFVPPTGTLGYIINWSMASLGPASSLVFASHVMIYSTLSYVSKFMYFVLHGLTLVFTISQLSGLTITVELTKNFI